MSTINDVFQKVRAVVLRSGARRDDVEDIVQEAFARLEAYTRSHEVRSEEAFLIRVAMNIARDHARRRRHTPVDVDPSMLEIVADDTAQPDEVFHARERMRRAVAGLDQLEPRARRCLLANRLEGLTCAEIAAREGLSVSAAEKQIARATLFLDQMDGRLVMRRDMTEEMALAEAAAWIVRLQERERSPATEAAFRAWMEEPEHARAFSRATETWDIIPGAAKLGGEKHRTQSRQRVTTMALAASFVLACIAGGAFWLTRDPAYATTVGQQETLMLNDGTRITLNTDSRITVAYSKAMRLVRLERGEALFEVAKNKHWPFIVRSGDEQVRAVGTTFTVRRVGGKLAVVLVEGKVEVTQTLPDVEKPKIAMLAPGERLTVEADANPVIDRPRIDAALAWRRGEVTFDNAPLSQAVAEINRYCRTQLTLADPELAALRISGVFQTRDPAEFANAIAQLHHLKVAQRDDRLVLSR